MLIERDIWSFNFTCGTAQNLSHIMTGFLFLYLNLLFIYFLYVTKNVFFSSYFLLNRLWYIPLYIKSCFQFFFIYIYLKFNFQHIFHIIKNQNSSSSP